MWTRAERNYAPAFDARSWGNGEHETGHAGRYGILALWYVHPLLSYLPHPQTHQTHALETDGIHAVESTHGGHTDSSVFYIPAAPLTLRNAHYLVRQRETFAHGFPAPDFPGGEGESDFVGPERGRVSDVRGASGKWAMGLDRIPERDGMTPGELQVVREANKVLGF